MKPQQADSVTWTEREDLVIRIASPEIAADKLCRSVAAVLRRRLELGLPDFDPRRKSPQHKGQRAEPD
jgi:hypothetical protein